MAPRTYFPVTPEVTPIKYVVRESVARTTFPHAGHTKILGISHSNDIFLRKCRSKF